MSSVVTYRAVTKRFRQQCVLQNLDLSVERGEYLGLVGMNGAGKTTAIKCLLDFCHVDAGGIEIFGIDHRQLRSRARLAFLPERFTPPYYLTGRDFLRYMGRLHGVNPEPAQRDEVLAAVDLDPAVLEKSVGALSKGMGQKLGLAGALLSGKELMLLDEPMSGLDPRARARFKQELLELKARGQTMFFSTHMLSDVEALCDRIAILHRGKLAFIGPPQACCAAFQADDLEQAYMRCVDSG